VVVEVEGNYMFVGAGFLIVDYEIDLEFGPTDCNNTGDCLEVLEDVDFGVAVLARAVLQVYLLEYLPHHQSFDNVFEPYFACFFCFFCKYLIVIYDDI
jgi:hypothetical protein